MPETYMDQERGLAAERRRRTEIAAKLQIAYLFIPKTVEDRRIEDYCNSAFGVNASDAARGRMNLWNDWRTVDAYDNQHRMHKLAAGALPLTETEQKFVDYVQGVTDAFIELREHTQAPVAKVGQRFPS